MRTLKVMQPLEHPGLVFRALDPADAEDAHLKGWYQAMRRGFHQGRGSEAGYQVWLDGLRADGTTLSGAWAEDDPVGDGTIPVATFASWAGRVNTGREVVPLHMISDVTVAPTHRRQGLLRKLMTVDLADAVAAGLPLAALTVSEGAIYGRFGFGLATQVAPVEVDVTARFRLRPDAPLGAGRLVMAEPAQAWDSICEVQAAHLETTRGAVSRPAFYRPMMTSAFDHENDSAQEPRQRAVVHIGPDGTADGYALYRLDDPDAAGHRWVRILDLVALTPATHLRLWRFVADIDLVHRVSHDRAPVDDPLSWALEEPHVVRRGRRRNDFLWLRVLDVPRALEARPWYADGSVVLGVDDPLGHAAGSWELTVRGGEAKVVRTDARPDVSLRADTLGALYLGGVAVPTLAAAGRVTGPGVDTFAALADGGPTPYCSTSF